ncbi:hypothetical protein [Ornithinimicrobium cerasi]|uniref:hypothetical protein n=1 Tax=Ornithinimicrobium cerasi TaxID=2248773 RepID=UPI001379B6B7|nr:hypothetical protein [Ornithinimicrobium cerasi]
MPYDPALVSSQRAQRQSQDAMKSFQKHNRQYQARMNRSSELGGRRAGAPSLPRDAVEPVYAASRAGARRSRTVFTVLVLLVLLVAAVSWSIRGELLYHWAKMSTQGVEATIEGTDDWNVRPGPSMGFSPIGLLHPGDRVIVTCLESPWAQLQFPHHGAFVHIDGLALKDPARSC